MLHLLQQRGLLLDRVEPRRAHVRQRDLLDRDERAGLAVERAVDFTARAAAELLAELLHAGRVRGVGMQCQQAHERT